VLTSWSRSQCGRAATCKVTVTQAVTVSAKFAPVDTQPPKAPKGLRAVAASPNEIDLFWEPSSDNVAVTGYVIYRDRVKVTTVSGATTNFRDTGLKPSTSYGYQVRAIDAAGKPSQYSNKVFRTTAAAAGPAGPDLVPPSKPENLTADGVSTSEIVITWSASDDNVGVASYILYRDDSELTTIAGDETSFRDSGLDAGSGHVYYVVAVDAAGNKSDPSDKTKASTFSG
jgi:chitodextrinase